MLQQEESLEEVNITRVEMCEGLMEEMVAEEQQAVEECERAERQRVRWADMEEGQTEEKEVRMESQEKSQEVGSGTESEKLMSHETAVEEQGLEVGRSGKSQEEQQEAAVERRQKEEEMMAADQA